jgi:hypothetical protein
MLPPWAMANRERQGALTESRRLLRETRFIENGFVARVRAVGVLYWNTFTSINCLLLPVELFHRLWSTADAGHQSASARRLRNGQRLTTCRSASCATLLAWRLAVPHSPPDVASAFTISFVLLFCAHALLISAALRHPRSIDEAGEQPLREEPAPILEMTE